MRMPRRDDGNARGKIQIAVAIDIFDYDAARLLNDWNREAEKFWQVVPKEMLSRLAVPLSDLEEKRA